MTDDTNRLAEVTDEPRRSSTEALAADGSAPGDGTAARAITQRQADLAFVFAYDYQPGRPFRAVANLQQEVVDDVLGRWTGGEPVITITANFNAFIATYSTRGGGPGEYFLLFTQYRGLQPGQRYRFDAGAAFFVTRFNLLEVGLEPVSGGGSGGGGSGGGGGDGSGGGGNQTE